MAKETVVDYETTEVERTETYCDVCGGKMEEDEEEHTIVVDPEITGQHMPESPPTIQELADEHYKGLYSFSPSNKFEKEDQIWAAFLDVYGQLHDQRAAQADMWGGVMYDHTCDECVESISDGEIPDPEHIGRVRSEFEGDSNISLKTRFATTYRTTRSKHPFLSSVGLILVGLAISTAVPVLAVPLPLAIVLWVFGFVMVGVGSFIGASLL